jgi:hypothetical protein
MHGAQFVGRDEIEAEDDTGAVQAARSRGHGDLVEIWHGDRKVRTVVPAPPPLEHGAKSLTRPS